MRYHLTPVRTVSMKKTRNNKSWQVCEWEPLYTTGGNIKWCCHYENNREVPQKIKNRNPYGPVFTLRKQKQ